MDERLKAAADFFPPCAVGADIGTDHGRLPLYLLSSGRCGRMIVSDISEPALDKARALLTLHQLHHRAAFVRADGLDALTEPVQAISIMGMGGDTLCAILAAAPQRLHHARLILSPHTEIHKVRETLPGIGYRIERESIVRYGGRFYVIMLAAPGTAAYSEKERLLGPVLIAERPALYEPYLRWRYQVAQKALQAMAHAGDGGARLADFLRLETYIREELP